MTGPGGFGHTGPGGHAALDVPFRFQGECALCCCPPACHSGCWCATHLVFGLLMAPALFIPDTPHHTSQPTRIAEEEKGQFITHLSFDARSVWRGARTAAVSDMVCSLTRMVKRQEAVFYGGVRIGPTVARAVVQWQCCKSVGLPQAPSPILFLYPGDLSCQLLHTHGQVLL